MPGERWHCTSCGCDGQTRIAFYPGMLSDRSVGHLRRCFPRLTLRTTRCWTPAVCFRGGHEHSGRRLDRRRDGCVFRQAVCVRPGDARYPGATCLASRLAPGAERPGTGAGSARRHGADVSQSLYSAGAGATMERWFQTRDGDCGRGSSRRSRRFPAAASSRLRPTHRAAAAGKQYTQGKRIDCRQFSRGTASSEKFGSGNATRARGRARSNSSQRAATGNIGQDPSPSVS